MGSDPAHNALLSNFFPGLGGADHDLGPLQAVGLGTQ